MSLWTQNHDYVRALKHYQEALRIHMQLKGDECVEATCVYNNIATLYRALKDYDRSLEYHFKTLELKKILFGTEYNWDIASSYNNIGAVYHYKTEFKSALKFYQKALEIRRKPLPGDHPDVTASYYNVGQVYESLFD